MFKITAKEKELLLKSRKKVTAYNGVVSVEENKEVKNAIQWETINGSYFPCARTIPRLPEGVYQAITSMKGPFLQEKSFPTDNLLRFNDPTHNEIIKEIDNFWGLKKNYDNFGFIHKRALLMHGPAGCLDKDTFIQYEVRNEDGTRINHKGGTISKLYKRFNGFKLKVKMPNGGFRYEKYDPDLKYYASSIDENGHIFKNEIEAVVYSGKKNCFKVFTDSGDSIVATEDHKFYVGKGKYKSLKNLKIGSTIFIQSDTAHRVKNNNGRKNRYNKEFYVKYHPYAPTKIVSNSSGDYEYKRLIEYRAKIEAKLNQLELYEYINRLNNNELDDLIFLPVGVHIHHKDENPNNNKMSNLEIMDGKKHNGNHSKETLKYVGIETKIVKIKPVGERKTYDISMADPYNNFVANNIIVHNSGKSCISKIVTQDVIKRGNVVINCDNIYTLVPVLHMFRQVEPNRQVLVLLEDIDSIDGQHKLLSLLDGEDTVNNIFYLCTTNYMDRIEERIIRPGRFDRKIKVLHPPKAGRIAFLKDKLGDSPDVMDLANRTKGFSFASLRELLIGIYCNKQKPEKVIERLLNKGAESITASIKEESIMDEKIKHAIKAIKK